MRTEITENDKKIWISDISYKEYKVIIGSGESERTFLNDEIKEESIEISEIMEDSSQLTFSGCKSKKLKVVVAYVGDDLIGQPISVSAKASIGDETTEEITLFVGEIDEVTQNGNDDIVSTITARDLMAKAINLDVAEWYNTLEFPITLQEFYDSLSEYLATLGMALNCDDLPLGDTNIEETIAPQNLALKDVLIAIATLNGMYCYCAVDNSINFKGLEKLVVEGVFPGNDVYPSNSLFPNDYVSNAVDYIGEKAYSALNYQNYDVVAIDKVILREDSDDIGAIYGTGTNAYIVEGNFLLYGKTAAEMEEVATDVYELVKDIVYTPAKVVCSARPWIECGDLIALESYEKVIYTYVLENTFKGMQAISNTMQSKQDAIREEQNTAINTQIIQLRGKSNKLVRDIEHMSSTIYDGAGNSRIEQNASSIRAEVTRAKGVEAALSSTIAQTAEAIELKVSKGDISSSLSVESGQIKLASGRLIINSGNFTIDASGNIKATNADLSGKIGASEGIIGGFTIGRSSLTSGTTGSLAVPNGVYIGTDGISCGPSGKSAYFKVTATGDLSLNQSLSSITIGSVTSIDGDEIVARKFEAKMTATSAIKTTIEGNSIRLAGSTYSTTLTNTTIQSNDSMTVGAGRTASANSNIVFSGGNVTISTSSTGKVQIGGLVTSGFASNVLAFFGGTGSKQAAAITKPAATVAGLQTAVNAIIDALKGYGLTK